MSQRHRMRTLWFFLKQYPWLYGGLLLIMVAYAILETVNISIFFPLLKAAIGQEQAGASPFFAYLDRIIAVLPFSDPFLGACALLIGILLLKELLGFTRQACMAYGCGQVAYDARERVFTAYGNADYQFFLNSKQGTLIYNMVTAPGRLGGCLQYVPEMATALLMSISIGVLLLSISIPVTLTLLGVGLLFNIVTHTLATRVSYHIGTARVAAGQRYTEVANELIDGIKAIRLHDAMPVWRAQFRHAIRRTRNLLINDAIWLALPASVLQLLPAAVVVGAALFFRYGFHGEPKEYIVIVSVYAYALCRLVPYLTSLGRLRMQIMGILPDVEVLHDVLREPQATMRDGTKMIHGMERSLAFEHVCVSYPNRPLVLRDITVDIRQGTTTAIVGPTGVGKSTLAHLLVRLFDPTQGVIRIDGVDITEYTLASLRRLIGCVSQDTFIFHSSIRDNITFGLQDASVGDVTRAATIAHAHEFIQRLPQGYDTTVGEKGLQLSGGQRQRVAIARAILRNPPLLILDEATSALDYHAELQVQQAMREASKDRTTIVIAHRLSTIVHADLIIVLDQGTVVEQGTHAALMQGHGFYRSLYESQENMARLIELPVATSESRGP